MIFATALLIARGAAELDLVDAALDPARTVALPEPAPGFALALAAPLANGFDGPGGSERHPPVPAGERAGAKKLVLRYIELRLGLIQGCLRNVLKILE